MNRKQLEILLSSYISDFPKPKAELEQYLTPPRVAANLLHFAQSRGDIEDKSVVDLGSGTGMLGIGAMFLGASQVTFIDKDRTSTEILKSTLETLELQGRIIVSDIFTWEPKQVFNTALMNPPFGIQQPIPDIEFLKKAVSIAKIVYSIHDGSPKNIEKFGLITSKVGIEVLESYIDEFPLKRQYPWHSVDRKLNKVLVIRATLR